MAPPTFLQNAEVSDVVVEFYGDGLPSKSGRVNAWVSVRLDHSWVAHCRVDLGNGPPSIGELRVAAEGPPPAKGLSTALLRTLTVERVLSQAVRDKIEQRFHEKFGRLPPQANVDAFLAELGRSPISVGGPERGSDLLYARVAAEYVAAATRDPRRANALTAATLNARNMPGAKARYTAASVATLVKEARRRGLLTAAPRRGLAGGELTPAATTLVETGYAYDTSGDGWRRGLLPFERI